MLQINNLNCPLDYTDQSLENLICRKLHIQRSQLKSFSLIKQSLDARKKPLHFVLSLAVTLSNEQQVLKKELPGVSALQPYSYTMPDLPSKTHPRPVITGFGPCGMFAALLLAEAGLKPIVLERGSAVEQRIRDVENYWKNGVLDPDSNVQFGEGGAGTFSDGKLTTRVKDARIAKVAEELIEAGADPEIAILAHAHIGTDHLRSIVRNIRNKVIQLGGEVRFNTCMENILVKDRKLEAVIANGERIDCQQLILAPGHSARDTFVMLNDRQVAMEAKDFAVGVRVEHPQSLIDKNQYKEAYGHPRLKSAEYRLTCQTSVGRGAYTFCMCPGGTVVASSSEEGSIVTNGMSEYARDLDNANSALLVQVRRDDFGYGVLDGMHYQHELEKLAWKLGGSCGKAPCQKITDYLAHIPSTENGSLTPSYSCGVTMTDLHPLFSDSINQAMEEALINFDHKIPGFATGNGLMTGVETRSSSPVRILRNEQFQSISTAGLYPAGEGAGFAGGIVSAALDGIRVSEQVIRDLKSMEDGHEK